MASSGLAPSRFTSPVDPHFLCRICSQVVLSPLECLQCEQLLCTSCAQSVSVCPYCEYELNTKAPALFARKVYTGLQVHCMYWSNGCAAITSITELDLHEQDCVYEIVECASPICSSKFMKKEKLSEKGQPLVCSVLCRTVFEFKGVLETQSQVDVLRLFYRYLNDARTVVESQVRQDMEPLHRDVDRKLAEVREFYASREVLLNELEDRKWKYHPGKWNGGASLWTCCNSTDKFALGCRRLV